MRLVVGLFLLLIGSSLFVLSFSRATRTDIVIDMSFALKPNDTHEAYHHTRVFGKSILMGEVMVENGGINFTTYGYNVKHLENVFIDQNYSFIINPADDLYSFKFKNSENGVKNSIGFTVEETWLSYFMLIPAFIGVLILVAGLVLVILSHARLLPFFARSSRARAPGILPACCDNPTLWLHRDRLQGQMIEPK